MRGSLQRIFAPLDSLFCRSTAEVKRLPASRTTTERPCAASSLATRHPHAPAPTTRTSGDSLVMRVGRTCRTGQTSRTYSRAVIVTEHLRGCGAFPEANSALPVRRYALEWPHDRVARNLRPMLPRLAYRIVRTTDPRLLWK